ncbi:hypothetical protein BDZ89DRAFT_1135293 [Hymenopellis radicata]|nr:hypothetical protein BDZ89DRAFT_1135293 [Hymenopellis radicata]
MASAAPSYKTIVAKSPAPSTSPSLLDYDAAALSPPVTYCGSGDTYLVSDLLAPELASTAFERVKDEVEWNTMHHRGGEVPRLVARVLGHPVNHVLIQHYRSGHDHISEHADKTIDIVRHPVSNIVNVSLGATRTMVLRHKDDDSQSDAFLQTIPLPHNSMFVLGLETNREWKHGIHPVRTFLTKDLSMIYGQGAVGKTRAEARPVVNGGQMVRHLIGAFGEENRDSQFDWDTVYGGGFDVLHFGNLQR